MIGQRLKHKNRIGIVRATRAENGILVEFLVEWFSNTQIEFSWIPANEGKLLYY
jgi:hypothetical protein